MLKRPVTIEQLIDRMSNFTSETSRLVFDNFDAHPTDVYISTYSKSGTTWMQQIVHQLKSGGDTSFEEISAVIPWLESAVDMGIDPTSPQSGSFRAFKCHMLHEDLPQGARYLSVVRDPLKVLPSFYRFFEGWWFEPGSITLDDFAEKFYFQGSNAGRHWDHLIDSHSRIDKPDTLVLCYEDMLQVPDKVPLLVAEWIGLDIPDPIMEKIIYHCSREYMVEKSHQFDEHLLRAHRDAIWGLPPGGSASKAVASANPIAISEKTKTGLDTIWAESIGQLLGFADYNEYRKSLPNLLNVNR